MSDKKITPPRWDLSPIFTSINGEDYKKSLKKYENDLNQIENLLNTSNAKVNFEKTLVICIDLLNDALALYSSFTSYAYCLYSTDTTNTDYLNNLSMIEEKGLRNSKIIRIFQGFLFNNSDLLAPFYTSYPQYSSYQYIFEELLEDRKHQMSTKEESVAEEMQLYAGDAWGKLQEQLIANLVDIRTNKTFNELRTEAYSNNEDVRKKAYKKELELLQGIELPLAACLNNLKGATLALNKRREWADALDRSCASSRITKKTLNALIGAIEDSLPLWRDYMKTKARLLQKDALPFYDLFAPLKNSQNEEKIWTFSEARDYIIERYTSFSKSMGDFAKKAFDENWIDAEIRKGKVGGAYDTGFGAHGVSRILSNFNGTFNDVTTLAHELGHAYHDSCVKDLPSLLADYPMTLAETASIFAETIVMNDMISKTEGFEKAKLIELHLCDANQVLVDILSRFYFEKSVFEERKDAELSAKDFCRLMDKAQEASYGNGLSSERHSYMWALKGHYYSSSFDFYNYPYAFGLLFAVGLYARFQKEGSAFSTTYTEILKNTGSMSCEEVCRKAGFDIEEKQFWASGIAIFKKELDELKDYAKRTGY